MSSRSTVTTSAALAEAARLLLESGYQVSRSDRLGVPGDASLLAEDPFGVVGLVAYGTWREAAEGWRSIQDNLVDIISQRLTRQDPKAWDAYVVLLVPTDVGTDEEKQANQIRRDIGRARKLVAVGEELRSLDGVERTLLPLLQLARPEQLPHDNLEELRSLPDLIEGQVDRGAVQVVVDAYLANQPLLERLFAYIRRA